MTGPLLRQLARTARLAMHLIASLQELDRAGDLRRRDDAGVEEQLQVVSRRLLVDQPHDSIHAAGGGVHGVEKVEAVGTQPAREHEERGVGYVID